MTAATPCSLPVAQAVSMYSNYYAEKAKKKWKIEEDLHRDLESGWMTQYLLDAETMLWGRWDYWTKIQLEGKLPKDPIPRISFSGMAQARESYAVKMWQRCIDAVGGGGWSLSNNIEYILDWALFGFGHLKEIPQEPQSGASMRLYQLFDLWPLLIWPYDYLADMMAEAGIGKGSDFYPTPHELVEAMVLMTYGTGDKDHRTTKVQDPCVGTGRMLLHASNYSLRLYGQDISALACKTTIFNGYLYAPWLVKAIEFDDSDNIVQSAYARQWSNVLKLESVLSGRVFDGEYHEAEKEAVNDPDPEPPITVSSTGQTSLFDSELVVQNPPFRAAHIDEQETQENHMPNTPDRPITPRTSLEIYAEWKEIKAHHKTAFLFLIENERGAIFGDDAFITVNLLSQSSLFDNEKISDFQIKTDGRLVSGLYVDDVEAAKSTLESHCYRVDLIYAGEGNNPISKELFPDAHTQFKNGLHAISAALDGIPDDVNPIKPFEQPERRALAMVAMAAATLPHEHEAKRHLRGAYEVLEAMLVPASKESQSIDADALFNVEASETTKPKRTARKKDK